MTNTVLVPERIGMITGSKFDDVMTNGRDKKGAYGQYGFGVGALTYAMQLAEERISGVYQNDNEASSTATRFGNDNEPFAMAHYQKLYKVNLTKGVFTLHPNLKNVGCTPDYLDLLDKSNVQIKCPLTNFLKYYNDQEALLKEYGWQTIGEAEILDYEYTTLFVYNPRFDKEHNPLSKAKKCSYKIELDMNTPEILAKRSLLRERLEAFDEMVELIVSDTLNAF